MVIRAIASFSVGPTVSESILIASRRAREETRFSTPGLFRHTRSVFAWAPRRFFLAAYNGLRLCRGFDQRVVWTADHFVQRSSGRHHRVNGVFLLDAEIDEDGFLEGAGSADS